MTDETSHVDHPMETPQAVQTMQVGCTVGGCILDHLRNRIQTVFEEQEGYEDQQQGEDDTEGDIAVAPLLEQQQTEESRKTLMRSNDTITSTVGSLYLATIEEIYKNALPVKWQIANVSGDNNRTKGSVIASGSVIIQTLTLNGPNRQNATYTAQLQGYGAYTVGA